MRVFSLAIAAAAAVVARCSPTDASAAGSGAPGFPLFPLVSESRRCVLMTTERKKAFKGLVHFLSDMVISLCCAQTLLTPLVFAVTQHTQGKKTLKKRQDFLVFINSGVDLR